MRKTIYVEKTVRETKAFVELLDNARRERPGEIVFDEVRARIQLEVAGNKPYAKMRGFDLFFEESPKAKRVIVVAKPVNRNPIDRLADLVAFRTFGYLA